MERQRVRPAIQLFSRTISLAFRQIFGEKYADQAKIIEIIDSWVDVMNSRLPYEWKDLRCALGKILIFCSMLVSAFETGKVIGFIIRIYFDKVQGSTQNI